MASYKEFLDVWHLEKEKMEKIYLNKHPLDYTYNINFNEIFTDEEKNKEISEYIFQQFKFLHGLCQDFLVRHSILLKSKNISEDNTFAVCSIIEIKEQWKLWLEIHELENDEYLRFFEYLPKELESFYELYRKNKSYNVLNFFEDLCSFLVDENKIKIFINSEDSERFLLVGRERLRENKQQILNNIKLDASDSIYLRKKADAWFKDQWKDSWN